MINQKHPFEYCFKCGGENTVHFAGPWEKHPKCIMCKETLWLNPKPVAVGVITSLYGNLDGDWFDHVLLGRRSINPAQGMLALPGGFVEPNEPPHLAAQRECLEELAINVEFPETPRWVLHSSKFDTILMFYLQKVSHEIFEAALPTAETSEVVRVRMKDAALLAAKGEIAFPLHSRVLIELAL